MTVNERLKEIKSYACVDKYEHCDREVVNDLMVGDFQWLMEQVAKVGRYEEALKEIAEYGGADMHGNTCAVVAKEALE